MKTVFMTSIFILCYLPLIFYFVFVPYMTRKTTIFGVSVPEEVFDDEAVVHLRKSYTKIALGFSIPVALVVLIFCLLGSEPLGMASFAIGTFIELGFFYLTYLKFHKAMKGLKEKFNWVKGKTQVVVVDTEFSKKKVLISPVWFLLHIIIIVGTVIAGYALYDKMPDRIPMKYNLNGEVINWANKSYKFLLFAPSMQMFMTVLMGFVYWMTGKAKQQIDAQNPEASIEQNRIFRYRWSVYTVFASLALVLMFGYMQFSFVFSTNMMANAFVPMIFAGGIIIGSIVLSISTGQGGSRIKVVHDASGKEVNRDDDRFWKLGIFYYNPDDPAIFLEKRFGLGWTNNWARSASWLMVVGFIILMVLIIFLTSYLTK